MSANARRISLQHPLDIDGKLVSHLRVRWPAPHLVDDAFVLPDDPALRIAASVSLLTGLAAPAAYRVHDDDVRSILEAAETLRRP